MSEVAEQLKAEIPSLKTAAELSPQEPGQELAPQPAAPDSPPFDPTPPRAKSWGETVRPWESYPTAGVERVEVKSPDMTGIRFADSRKRTTAEKTEMESAGLRFWNQPESWLEKATPEARDRTKTMARSFAERRMAEDKEKEIGR
ncbi:MAG: hypothetical protein BGO49_28570 [Planctomycetales bacterium 71-10]|nr:MAG: hypothetical protein BGO49_28570 [Planctomycetales bacterium 71-10]